MPIWFALACLLLDAALVANALVVRRARERRLADFRRCLKQFPDGEAAAAAERHLTRLGLLTLAAKINAVAAALGLAAWFCALAAYRGR